MKTNKKYNERLLKFAKHLEKITNHPEFGLYKSASLVEIEEKRNVSFLIIYHEWVFEELPNVFTEWSYAEKFGQPSCKGCFEDEGTLAAVTDFFDLKMTEVCHLFDLDGFQDINRYGGTQLNFDSDGPTISKNIFELVEYRMRNTN
jgi:hypothetical protein